MNRKEAEKKLKEIFGFDTFYDDQWKTIDRILRGKRVLLIEKTGFGKSLCYQFSATQFDGISVIFSPLIALMRDQVSKLKKQGVKVECLNSEQSRERNGDILEQAKKGELKIIYIAPERQENSEWLEAVRHMNLSMVVIDEAHCISTWGHDFRPSFRRIINVVNLLPMHLPVLATTATATGRVQEDILHQISGDVELIRGNLMRANFNLRVIKVGSEDEKMIWLGHYLNKLEGNGIIYSGTRVNTEIYSRWFQKLGLPATRYNAGLDPESRKSIEEGLQNNKWKAIISTNALGMGIDKLDIHFLIHTQIPASPIHYYQEIGRAGRDGKPTYIYLFYCRNDNELPEAFIKNNRPKAEEYEKVIDELRSAQLGMHEIMKNTNLSQTPVRVILADLMDQKIINVITEGSSKKYELRPDAPKLDTAPFDELRKAKSEELDRMIEYVDTEECRMQFLCDYLEDNYSEKCNKCDNDMERHIKVVVTEEWQKKLDEFHNNYFPVLKVETKYSRIRNGVAAGYYSFSNIGSTIHRCKYEKGGDFPDFLVELTERSFLSRFNVKDFDWLVFVPPTESGTLVQDFANKLSRKLKIPISLGLKKTRKTKTQRIFQNYPLKRDNIKDVFKFDAPEKIKDASILLVDDIYDSGSTIKELGRMFSRLGAKKIVPLAIAKTVGGKI